MFIEGIGNLIASDPTVQSILGTPSTRADKANGIWAVIAPDEPLLPYITYMEIHSESILTYAGVNPTREIRYQFSIFGSTHKSVKLLSNAVRAVLDGFQGQLNDPDNVYIGHSMPISEHDEVERELKATIYSSILDYQFIVYSPK